MEKSSCLRAWGLFVAVYAQFVPGQPRTTRAVAALRWVIATGFSFDIHIV